MVATTDSTVVIDLDGVVWLAGEELPGAARAVALLRESNYSIIFATNNSSPTAHDLIRRLDRVGIQASLEEVISSAQAAALAVPEGSSALIFGEAGVHEAAENRSIVQGDDPGAVIVGWSRDFTFQVVAQAANAIRSGALFVATNDDPTHPTPKGLLPGTGAFVAAIATASETLPLIAGKPGRPMVSLVQERTGNVVLMIGDRPSTDGAFAEALNVPFGLVRSEATPEVPDSVTYSEESLLTVVEIFLNAE